MRTGTVCSTCALIAALVFGCSAGTGEIRGPVTDQTGKPVAAARVIATNTDTGIAHETKANGRGWYFVVDLPPGRYDVRAEAPGHAVGAVETITLERGDTLTQDLWLAQMVSPMRAL